MENLIGETLHFFSQIGKIFGETTISASFFETERRTWAEQMTGGALDVPNMLLKAVCKNARKYLRFINWDGFTANYVVAQCAALAILWLVFPVNHLLWWVCRIFAWTILGPWMKFVDIFFVHSWYKTSDELAKLVDEGVEEPDPDLPNFQSFLESDFLAEISLDGRLIAEHAIRVKAMRDVIYGKYSEFVSFMDDSRHESIPRPESSAEPYNQHESSDFGFPGNKNVQFSKMQKYEKNTSQFVQSQKLCGKMIMAPEDRSHSCRQKGIQGSAKITKVIDIFSNSKGGLKEPTTGISDRDYSQGKDDAPSQIHALTRKLVHEPSFSQHIKME